MRIGAVLAACAAVSALFALSGCVAAPAPPTVPTAGDIDTYNQSMLDATWDTLGLGGVPQEKTLPFEAKDRGNDLSGVFDCLDKAGIHGGGLGAGPDTGYALSLAGDAIPTARQNASLYYCMVRHPVDPVVGGMLQSASEKKYLWQLYTSWQEPCLATHGIAISDPPTRVSFFAASTGILWSPYAAIESPQVEPSELDRMCGPQFGVLTKRLAPASG
jgi:hypothetical protein